MPLVTNLMLKCADLFYDGTRSPKSYQEQLQRCAGLIPLNVCASISNRCLLDVVDHDALEREFLSDTTKNRVRRRRQKALPNEPPSLVFTRAGALLNLKLLLGLSRPASPYRATALGAVALHANDYLESEDGNRLASGTLPIIAEFAPMWELLNRREPMHLLRRSYYLYTLLQEDERMQALFAGESGIADLTFSGLRFPQYFALLFGIHTAVELGVQERPFPTSIVDAADIARKAGISAEQFAVFASEKALTLTGARETFGPVDDVMVFTERVTSSRWTCDQRLLRKHPLVRLDDGRFLVTDLQFLFENVSAGLSWSLAQRLPEKRRGVFFSYWGEVFELYVQRFLGHYFSGEPIGRTYAGSGQIDALLRVGNDVIVFEVKAGFVREDVKGSRDVALVEAALREKYVTNQDGNRKGVRQLAASAAAVLAGEVPDVPSPQRVYPVLIGEDPLLQTLALNTYLNDVFRQEIGLNEGVRPLTVLLIDELEQVVPSIRAGDVTWQELLESRFNGERVVATSVQNAFFDIGGARNLPVRNESFLERSAQELIGILNEAYKNFR